MARFAAGRPLAWLGDDFGIYPEARETFLERRRGADQPTELIDVNPRLGITGEHLTAIATWARSL